MFNFHARESNRRKYGQYTLDRHNPNVGSFGRIRNLNFQSSVNNNSLFTVNTNNLPNHSPYVGRFTHAPPTNSILFTLRIKSLLSNEGGDQLTNEQEVNQRLLRQLPSSRFSIDSLCHSISSSGVVDSSNDVYDIPQCSICLENFKDGDEFRSLSCAHCYHRKCIDRWLILKSRCPLCLKVPILDSSSSLAASDTHRRDGNYSPTVILEEEVISNPDLNVENLAQLSTFHHFSTQRPTNAASSRHSSCGLDLDAGYDDEGHATSEVNTEARSLDRFVMALIKSREPLPIELGSPQLPTSPTSSLPMLSSEAQDNERTFSRRSSTASSDSSWCLLFADGQLGAAVGLPVPLQSLAQLPRPLGVPTLLQPRPFHIIPDPMLLISSATTGAAAVAPTAGLPERDDDAVSSNYSSSSSVVHEDHFASDRGGRP